ncbi:T9SS type A sorting domain-containing protein [Flavobacterium sp. J27]|uniref:T9SS type A sorting domain-containing protein n=1 Tax=Flavobacterium sp. J27 TaxID=2060419 RepID=UPI0010326499|nr:T9SS type A sorting domain-containing protein [Flavobacterium sp. J27]
MNKNYIIIYFLFSILLGFGQSEEIAPSVNVSPSNSQAGNYTNYSVLTTEFLYDIGTSIGAQGNAGVVFINNQFWVSAWNSSNIHVLSNTGAFIETFQVAGLSGTRSMTTDGVNVYCGTAQSSIYVVDPITRMLTNTISITTTSSAQARFCTYDASLDSGAGGFWIANFNTDITSVSMTGNQLSVIPAATHGFTGMYGAAVDGSGLLYIYHQGPPNNDTISSIDLSTGLPTGLTYDFFTNDASGTGSTSSLAGGLFISNEVVSGETIVVGVSQATPNNLLFGININDLLSVSTNNSSSFNWYPNPVKDAFIISSKNEGNFDVKIHNLLGQQVMQVKNNPSLEKIDVSALTKGTYIVTVDADNAHDSFKIIKE